MLHSCCALSSITLSASSSCSSWLPLTTNVLQHEHEGRFIPGRHRTSLTTASDWRTPWWPFREPQITQQPRMLLPNLPSLSSSFWLRLPLWSNSLPCLPQFPPSPFSLTGIFPNKILAYLIMFRYLFLGVPD